MQTYREQKKQAEMARVSEALKDYMRHHGMSQSDLARYAGIPRDSISRYLRMASVPNNESYDKLSKAMRVDLRAIATANAEPLEPVDELNIDQQPDGRFRVQMDRTVTFEQLTSILNALGEK